MAAMGIAFEWEPGVKAALDRLIQAGGPGIACFDADGTLWSGDVVVEFIHETLDRLPARNRDGFEATLHRVLGEINQETAGLQHAIFEGLEHSIAAAWAAQSFAARIAPTCYEPVRNLVAQFDAAGFEVWICSGSPAWLVESGAACFGVPPERVIASQAVVIDGVLQSEPLLVTAGPGKAEALRRRDLSDLAFAAGDSMSDFDMLSLARIPLVMAPPDPDGRRGDLVAQARRRGWLVQQVG